MTVVVLLLCFHPEGLVKELLSNLELRKVKICCWSTEIFLLKSCLLWFHSPLFIDMALCESLVKKKPHQEKIKGRPSTAWLCSGLFRVQMDAESCRDFNNKLHMCLNSPYILHKHMTVGILLKKGKEWLAQIKKYCSAHIYKNRHSVFSKFNTSSN